MFHFWTKGLKILRKKAQKPRFMLLIFSIRWSSCIQLSCCLAQKSTSGNPEVQIRIWKHFFLKLILIFYFTTKNHLDFYCNFYETRYYGVHSISTYSFWQAFQFKRTPATLAWSLVDFVSTTIIFIWFTCIKIRDDSLFFICFACALKVSCLAFIQKLLYLKCLRILMHLKGI